MSKLFYSSIFIFLLFSLANSQSCQSTPDCNVVDAICYSLIACVNGNCVRNRIEDCCLDFFTCFNRSTSCSVVYCNFEKHLCESIDNCTTTTGTASATTTQTSIGQTSFSSYSSISTATIVPTTVAQTISSYLSSGQTTFSSGEGQYAGPLFEECLNCIDINCASNFGLCKVIPVETSSSKCKSWKPRLLLNPNKRNNLNNNQIDIINEDSNSNPYYTSSSTATTDGSDSSPYYTGSSSSGGSGNTGKRIKHPKLGHHCCPYIPTCF